jgi:fibronectin-binding autotransporter adhesin
MRTPRILAASIASILLTSAALRAQTWDGGGVAGGSLLWSTATNWNGDVVPVNNGTANVAFAGTIDLTSDMDANWSINSLAFNSGAGAFTLGSTSGFTLTLGAGGITNNDDSTQAIANAITLGAAQTWNVASTGALNVSGAINNGGNLLTIQTTSGNATLSGVFSGAGGLTKTGANTLILSGGVANTYTGTTTVNAGTLVLAKTAGVNALAGPVIVGDGTGIDTLQLGASNQIPNASSVSVNSSGVFNLAGFNESLLVVVVNGGSVTTGTGTLTISTSLNMTAGSISSTGAGSLLMQGNVVTNAAAASATIAGTLDLGTVVRSFTIADGGAANDLDVTADINATTGGINKLGSGTLRLSANNLFSGGLNVAQGTVAIGSNTAAGTNTIALSGGTITSDGGPFALANSVNLNGDSTANNITLNGATLITGNRTLTINSGAVLLGGTISGDISSNFFTKNGAGTLAFAGATGNTYAGTVVVNEGTLALVKTPGVTAINGNLAVGDGSGPDVVNVNGSNQIADTSFVTINGGGVFNLGAGVIETFQGLGVDTGGSAAIGDGTLTVSSVQLTGTGTITGTPGGTLQLVGNVTTVASGASQSTITAFTNLGGGFRTFTIGDGTAQFDATLAGLTNGALVKEGAGGLLLTGGGSSLAVTLNSGLLAAVGSNSFGNGTLTLNGGTIMPSGSALSFPNAVSIGGDVNFGGTTDATYNGAMTIGTGGAIFTISNTSVTTFSGAIGQSVPNASFTKIGSGILRFEGGSSNTYSGTTTVNAGTLILNKNAGSLAIPGNLVIGDGTGSDIVQLLQSNQIADTSAVTINGNASLDMGSATDTIGSLSVAFNSSVNVGTGNLTVGSGGLQISGGTISGSNGILTLLGDLTSPASNVGFGLIFSAVNLGGGTRTFDVDNGAAAFEVDLSGVITGGTMVKAGDGIMRFSGSATNGSALSVLVNEGELRLLRSVANVAITGPLTIGDGIGGTNADVVRLAAAEQIGSGAAVQLTINSSGLLDLAGFNESIGDLRLAGGNVTTGAGTLTLIAGSSVGINSLASTTPASITGNLGLSNQAKTFTVASGGLAIDLDIPAIISSGGIIKAGAGVLRLGGNNTIALGLTINGGTVLLGSDSAAGTGLITLTTGTLRADGGARTIANTVGITGASTIDGVQNLTLNGSISLAKTASLTKNDTGTLTFGSAFTLLDGALTLNQGTLAVNGTKTISASGTFTENPGGTFIGALINQGIFTYNGGVFDGTLQNEGVFVINSDFNAQDGFSNLSTITVGAAGSLNANGTGLLNEGTLMLAAGTLQAGGTGPVINNGEITGYGLITGSAGFTNNAQVTVNGGNLTLANSGAQSNAGNIAVPSGRQLRLNSPLSNTGTIALAGGTIGSTAALTNNAGGTVSGRGTITAPLNNNGGTLRAEGGTLNVTNAFASSGLIRVEGGAGLAGGAITNTGRIQGDGSIANAITNNGRIEAAGTLALGGTVTQNAAGTIAAGAGNTVLVAAGLSGNAGTISLTGGSFDNNGFPLNNTGQISGHGVIATGGTGLTNNGSITFTGGLTTVSGNVTNAATRKIETVASSTLFTGNVVNNGTFKNTDGRFTFAGTYTENGAFISDPADNFFTDLIVNPNGVLVGGLGDRFFVSGNFLNGSLQAAGWQTSQAELTLHGGSLSSVAFAGSDAGPNYAGYTNNFAWGTLRLEVGQSLTLGDGNGTPGAALYATIVDLDGGLGQIGSITGNGFNIYYDPANAANAYLGNQIYPFANGGALVPVPEPSGCWGLGWGAIALCVRRRRIG